MDSTLGANIGIFAIWTQGDWVTKAVAVMLLVMSVTSWIVIFIKTLDIIKYKGLSQKTEAFWIIKRLPKNATRWNVMCVWLQIYSRLLCLLHRENLVQIA